MHKCQYMCIQIFRGTSLFYFLTLFLCTPLSRGRVLSFGCTPNPWACRGLWVNFLVPACLFVSRISNRSPIHNSFITSPHCENVSANRDNFLRSFCLTRERTTARALGIGPSPMSNFLQTAIQEESWTLESSRTNCRKNGYGLRVRESGEIFIVC